MLAPASSARHGQRRAAATDDGGFAHGGAIEGRRRESVRADARTREQRPAPPAGVSLSDDVGFAYGGPIGEGATLPNPQNQLTYTPTTRQAPPS